MNDARAAAIRLVREAFATVTLGGMRFHLPSFLRSCLLNNANFEFARTSIIVALEMSWR